MVMIKDTGIFLNSASLTQKMLTNNLMVMAITEM